MTHRIFDTRRNQRKKSLLNCHIHSGIQHYIPTSSKLNQSFIKCYCCCCCCCLILLIGSSPYVLLLFQPRIHGRDGGGDATLTTWRFYVEALSIDIRFANNHPLYKIKKDYSRIIHDQRTATKTTTKTSSVLFLFPFRSIPYITYVSNKIIVKQRQSHPYIRSNQSMDTKATTHIRMEDKTSSNELSSIMIDPSSLEPTNQSKQSMNDEHNHLCRYHPIKVLGVCGGIGSGKSTACQLLVSEFQCLQHIGTCQKFDP
jgi:hypothetical protein